jgi:hypothetical protein
MRGPAILLIDIEHPSSRKESEAMSKQRVIVMLTAVALMSAIFEYIEGFYNRYRFRPALCYGSPADFEEDGMPKTTAA